MAILRLLESGAFNLSDLQEKQKSVSALHKKYSGRRSEIRVNALVFTADGAQAVSASLDKTQKVCELRTGELLATFVRMQALMPAR